MRSIFVTLILIVAAAGGCSTGRGVGNPASKSAEAPESRPSQASDLAVQKDLDTGPSSQTAANTPRTIRDFFMLLPDRYFVLEGCDRQKDNDCRDAKSSYLKTFLEIEDTSNGYLKAGCDGAQSCIEMTSFKRPDSSYLIAVVTEAEMIREQFFLDHKNGQWTEISETVIPEFSRNNIYELPRRGTDVRVFAKKVIEKGPDYEISEKGAKIYDLVWKDGRFSIRK